MYSLVRIESRDGVEDVDTAALARGVHHGDERGQVLDGEVGQPLGCNSIDILGTSPSLSLIML